MGLERRRAIDRITYGRISAFRAIRAATFRQSLSPFAHGFLWCARKLRYRAVEYDRPLWNGVFDAAYTRVGDYLVRPDGTWFVAAQQPLLPVLCVRADRIVSFVRAAAPTASGVNTYGGVTAATNTPLLRNWPASVRTASAAGPSAAALPGDASVTYWTVLLPCYPGVVLRLADLMIDDLESQFHRLRRRTEADLGWRLSVKQAAT